MYRYSVPINNLSLERDDKAAVASILSQMGVETVFFCIGSYHFNKRDRQTEMEALRRNCDFFRARGFGVGAWMWTFMGAESDMGFLPMRGALGKDSLQSICPSDENFRAFAADYLCEVALCGVDTVLYDDDYRYGNLVCGTSCFCKNHLAYTSNILGETVTEEELKPHLFSGRENRYRSAWLASKRHYFALFAKEMRTALDRVAPHVRLGICSCFPNWDHDGISSFELAKLLAGKTRPPAPSLRRALLGSQAHAWQPPSAGHRGGHPHGAQFLRGKGRRGDFGRGRYLSPPPFFLPRLLFGGL